MNNWRDYFSRPVAGEAAVWEKRGPEIRSRPRRDEPGLGREGLLQYHRPLLEGGEVEFEFFHDPGRAAAAPAIGRTAFLLSPDGLKLHRVTDGKHDRGEAAGESPPPSALPLLPRGWNRARLTVGGRRVVVTLNGEEIYRGELGADGPLTFGLFHFADAAEARVRNVRLRGEWPGQPPAGGRVLLGAGP